LRKKFFPGEKFQPPVGGAVSIFSPAKKSSRGEEISMSGLERLDRLSLPRRAWRQAEWQLPVRLDAVLSITSGVAIVLDTLSWLDNDVWQP
jgi:hypothetical protein